MSFSGTATALQSHSALAATVSGGTKRDGFSTLDTLGSVCRFRPGETILAEADVLQFCYKILRGAVRLSRISQDGRRQIVDIRSGGDFLGFGWDGRCPLNAEAMRDVLAVRYMRSRVERMIAERPEVRDCVLGMVRNELRSAHEHLITLGCQSAKQRVASFLLQLARKAGANDGKTIVTELGRQDMADYVGLTLETISRTLSGFRRIGAIALPRRRQIIILSKAKLRAQSPMIN